MKVVVQRISLPCDSFSQRRAAIILEVEVNVFACSATISACSKTSNWQQAVMLLEMVRNLQVQLTPGPHSSNWMSKCLAFLESWSSQGLQISTSREIEGGPPHPSSQFAQELGGVQRDLHGLPGLQFHPSSTGISGP